jgi:integrase
MCTYLNKTLSTYYFRRPVPDDLLGHFSTERGNPRTEWKRSLGTKDREQAKRLLRPHVTETDELIDNARQALLIASQPSPGGLAAQQREREERVALEAFEAARQERYSARAHVRTLLRQRMRMSTAELTVKEAAARDLLKEKEEDAEKLREAVAMLEARIATLGGTVPSYPQPGAHAGARPALSLSALFERYAASGTANPKTVSKWRSRVANLVAFLGHDDASRVTRADLNRWVEGLVAKGLSKKTVGDGYLPAVRVALGMAHDDGAIPTNPASGLKVRAPKAVQLRERDLTDDEAQTILRAALEPQPKGLAEKHALARRWVPWLCAYTGARVGEITQLRAMDLKQEGGVWIIHITPEAGSVKTGKARSVPIHSHLIEQGILELANAGDASSLFYREGAGNAINPAHKVRAADLAKWVRTLGVNDPEVQPNHGWRHRFKTMSRAAGIPEHIADRTQGHTPRHEGGKYGSGPLATLRDAIELIPRYDVGGPLGEAEAAPALGL